MTFETLSHRVTPLRIGAILDEYVTKFTVRLSGAKRHNAYFVLFALSVVLSTYARTVGASADVVSELALLLGSATCGWAWLFVRSLFVPSPKDTAAPLMLVLFILALQFVSAAGAAFGSSDAHVFRLASNMVSMVGSTFVILTLVEIARQIPGTPKGPERLFRQLFAAGYLALIIAAVLLIDGADEGTFLNTHTDTIQSCAALVALGGGFAALRFRHQNSLKPSLAADRLVRPMVSPTAADKKLAKRVDALVRDPDVYTQASLRVADIAALLGEPDYRVSRAITKVLGQSNFNRYINHYRIERVQTMLRDPEFSDRSILAIALDCGFGSIGPFNRAFRETTGMTPSAYREQRGNGGRAD